MSAQALPYVYRWNRQGMKDQPCAVTARSKAGSVSFELPGFGWPLVQRFNSIRVEFADGFTMITSGNAIRRGNQ